MLVRDGKGKKDRVTILPTETIQSLYSQIDVVKKLYLNDKKHNCHEVWMPDALARKYPSEARSFHCQYVFPSDRLSVDPRSDVYRRHHFSDTALQKQVKKAINAALIQKHASCHTFRHSFATHLLEDGYDIRIVQELYQSCFLTVMSMGSWTTEQGGMTSNSRAIARNSNAELKFR